MPKYAMVVGVVELRSNKPITPEQRTRALEQLQSTYDGLLLITTDDVEIEVRVPDAS